MMSKTEIATILGSLRKIPLFNSLNNAELQGIIEAPENGMEHFDSKSIILREEQQGDCMYVIVEGSAEVIVHGESGGRDITLATLYKGDFFGEQALLPGGSGRHNASIRSLHECRLFRIAKKHVLLNIQHEEEPVAKSTASNDYIETPEDQGIKDILKSMRLFRSLQPEEIFDFRNWTEVIDSGPGELIIKEDQTGEHLYVVLDGTVEVFLLDNEGKVIVLAEHKRGNYFGEQALMPGSNGKRNAYVRTNGRARLLKIPRKYFRLLLDRDSKLAETLEKIGRLQKNINSRLME